MTSWLKIRLPAGGAVNYRIRLLADRCVPISRDALQTNLSFQFY
jgi:hypothetical protein